MAGFPDELFEADHQQAIFSAMFGLNATFKPSSPLRPKLVYRSDTTVSIFLLYVTHDGNWMAVCNASREDTINVQEYWRLPKFPGGPGGLFELVQEFFGDVNSYVNNWRMPEGRSK